MKYSYSSTSKFQAYCKQKRYLKIDQHLARHFEYYGACLSSSLLFLCSLNDLHQSENKVVILANCGILILLF